VAIGVGLVLAGAAIAVVGVGTAIHQPAVTRIGVLLIIASITVFVIRSRRYRGNQRG
jgi:Flp pilus assembly protein TadB